MSNLQKKPFHPDNFAGSDTNTVEVKTITQLLDQQLKINKGIALKWAEGTLSYPELNQQVTLLARHLQGLGLVKNRMVAVYVNPGPLLVITLLAILRAGGCYLPLHLQDPPKRIKLILDDAEPFITITNEQLANEIKDVTANILIVDSILNDSSQAPAALNVEVMTHKHQPASVFYVSDTSGTPKGVVLSHAAILNYVKWYQNYFKINHNDVFILLHDNTSKESLGEMLLPLSVGAKLIIPTAEQLSPGKLLELIQRESVSVLEESPSALKILLIEQQLSACYSLRTIISSQEPLTSEVIDLYFQQLNLPLYNMYGVTEVALNATCFKYDSTIDAYQANIIGKPIANIDCYLLDEEGNEVGEGEIGELYIGGLGVAEGYLKRPTLNQEKFINCIINGKPSRCYKTGDLVYKSDDNLVYVGRKDKQIKINGNRIELEELKSYLQSCSDVAEVYPVLHEDEVRGKEIVLYVIPDLQHMRIPYHDVIKIKIDDVVENLVALDISLGGICLKRSEMLALKPGNDIEVTIDISPDRKLTLPSKVIWCKGDLAGIQFKLTTDNQIALEHFYNKLRILPNNKKLFCPTVLSHRNLRNYLMKVLPPSMVHTAAVWLSKMPKLKNQEPNYDALPKPNFGLREKKYLGPRNDVEATIAEMLYELLNIKVISINDNFLEMGGNSLTIMQLASRITREFKVDFNIPAIFNNPTIKAIAKMVATENKLGKTVPFRYIARTTRMPLSFAEERLYLLQVMSPKDSSYNITWEFNIKGYIDLKILEQSIGLLVGKHESLRTVYRDYGGKPYRRILSKIPLSFEVIDIVNSSHESQMLEVAEISKSKSKKPFLLSRAPLFRCYLILLGEKQSVLLFVIHNIIADDQSVEIMLCDLAKFYNSIKEDSDIEIERFPMQYADYAVWQKKYFTRQRYESDLRYWENQLSGAPPLSSLPTDNKRPPLLKHKSAHLKFVIPPKLYNDLSSFALRKQVTLFMLLMASFQVLLHRLTQEDDILVGTQIGGRNHEEIEDVVGHFVNQLVIRSNLEQDKSFNSFLKDVRATILDAYQHQNLPFELLLDHVVTHKSLSYSPLFQIMFDFRSIDTEVLPIHDVRIKQRYVANTKSLYDMHWSLIERTSDILVNIQYNLSLFHQSTIHKLFNYWVNILHCVITNPRIKANNVPLLSKDEKEKLLFHWNRTEHYFPKTKTITQLFEEQEERTPDRIAVIAGSYELTYEDLNARANQIAGYIHAQGVTPGSIVAVSLKRDIDLLPALLGILKAGATYLPIDFDNEPEERCKLIFNIANVKFLLTNHHDYNKKSITNTSIIDLDAIDPDEYLDTTTTIDNDALAYIVFTSGSTGTPKGVMVTHRNTVNFLYWCKTFFQPNELARVLASTSISFDIAIFELFAPIVSGGCVVICKDLLTDQDWQQQNVTLLNTIPALLKSYLDHNQELPASVQTINLTGETFDNEFAQSLYESGIDKIYNCYGPTETTTYSTISLVKRMSNEIVSIGSPIANTQVYILDQSLNPVPRGYKGEIYIGGEGVTKGYLNQKELTAEKYRKNTFLDENGSSYNYLYQTGDYGRYLPDGSIEYLGRVDYQSKVNGFRVEVEEIQVALKNHPDVRDAVVVINKDKDDNYQIIAYVILKNLISKQNLHNHIHKVLPDYMAPSAYIVLDRFPMKPNGKVDRSALPMPSKMHLQKHLPPRNDIEQHLVRIWQEILPIENIGIDDNFFDLGGQSLMIISLIYKINQTYHYNLSYSDFLNLPTIAHVAELIEGKVPVHELITNSLHAIEEDIRTSHSVLPIFDAKVAQTPGTILLTAATSFLGMYLLREFITNTQAEIYCIVLDGSEQKQFNERASAYGMQVLINHPHIHLLQGNLNKDRFGLTDTDWQALAEKVDFIYHAAEEVHYLYDYLNLRMANVIRTIDLLKLAGDIKPKQIHYISTLSAIFDKKNNYRLEQAPDAKPSGKEDGYSLTKWASEKILSDAKDRGFVVRMYRPGIILGDSDSGRTSGQLNHFWMLLKGCVQMKAAPIGLGFLHAMPVNTLAKIIATVSLDSSVSYDVANLSQPNPSNFDLLFIWLNENGFPLELTAYEEWRQKYLRNLKRDNALYPISNFYLEESQPLITDDNICLDHLVEIVRQYNLEIPRVDQPLFSKYLDYLTQWLRS